MGLTIGKKISNTEKHPRNSLEHQPARCGSPRIIKGN